MIILGIHGGFNVHQHDPSAALIINGKVHTVIEEERLLPLLKSLMISAKHVDNMDIALQTIIDPRTPIPFESRDVVSDLSDMLGIKYCAYPQPEININEEFSIISHQELIYMQLYNQLRNSQQSCSQLFNPKIKLTIERYQLSEKDLTYVDNNELNLVTPFIKIDVSDNGHGIEEKLLPKIFDRGVSTKMTRGIGLALSGQTCYLLKGFMKVNTEIGTGTKFSMYLPQEI